MFSNILPEVPFRYIFKVKRLLGIEAFSRPGKRGLLQIMSNGGDEMSRVTANGIQIEHETFGNPSGRPLLLIFGLGGQLIFWDDALCRDLEKWGLDLRT